MDRRNLKRSLLATVGIIGVLGLASPALAQDASNVPGSTGAQDQAASNAPEAGSQAPAVPVSNVNEGSEGEEIVVTGTLFRRTNAETPSPVTILSSESLARRGITNVADAVRSISADSSGSIPTAFTGGFGQGSAAVSLRGLSVNSTLTVIDGLRMVTYPLADDGSRAFVDLNTIPRVAIERIEVLKDGASSTYGADAIGGVVNIIMRKQFVGVDATAEAGISERGDGSMRRGSVLAGFGDIDERGWNIYVGAEYERNDNIWARDRGFPFNTGDLTSIGGANSNANLQVSGVTGTPAVVRASRLLDPANPLSGVPLSAAEGGGIFQLLNPAQCTGVGGTIFNGAQGQTCEQNLSELYGELQPRHTRYGATARASLQLGADSQLYLMGSYYRSDVHAEGVPPTPRTNNPVRTTTISLPDRLTNGQLNPNNPYASQGLAAQLYYRFTEFDSFNRITSDVIRGAAGISGSFGEGWTYSFDASAVSSKLEVVQGGILHLPTLLDVIRNGTYNFVDPSQNAPSMLASLGQDVTSKSKSNLYLAQGVVTKELFQLPGGPLQLGIGAHIRREELDQPNANPTQAFVGVNQYSAFGKRTVWAAFAEVSAPIVDQLEIQVSGRYDHYSTGFSNFSPKLGAKFTPIRQLALRGTYSRGFRAPSIAESGEGGVIGFTSTTPPASARAEHNDNAYVQAQAIGFNSAANPDLEPEKSRNFTLGAVVQPTSWLSLTADYYNIKKTNIITGGPLASEAIAAHYARQPLPAGYSVVLNPIDPEFPDAIRTIAIVNAPYANASALKTSGLDFSALLQFRPAEGVRFSSQIEATRILKYTFVPAEGEEEQTYVGTQGPYQISSGAGTPAWRANWSNSLELGPATITGTAYYTSGYRNTAEDITGAGTAEDCAEVLAEGPCRTDDFITVDLVGSYEVNDNFTFYLNVLNLFDAKAPVNAPNYAANNYNPTYTQQGAIGRFFRVGANIKF